MTVYNKEHHTKERGNAHKGKEMERDTGRRGCGQTKVSERTNPGHTLISDSWPPELCGSVLLLFKPARLWQLLGHKYMLLVNSL